MGSVGKTAWIILAVVVLAILDAISTLAGIQRGIFHEVNPLLAMTLEVHLGWFLLLKGGLTTLWAAVMTRERHQPWLLRVNAGFAAAYALVVARSVLYLL